jgi:hypothetical protein
VNVHGASAKHVMAFLAMTFIAYSTVSTVILQTFAYDDIEGDYSYLRADHSIQFNTPEHKLYKVQRGVMLPVCPVGMLVLYACLLRRQRHQLNAATNSSSDNNDATTASLSEEQQKISSNNR